MNKFKIANYPKFRPIKVFLLDMKDFQDQVVLTLKWELMSAVIGNK